MSNSPEKAKAQPKPRQKRRDDFILGDIIGRGAFGHVLEVVDKETKKHYAMKILPKALIIREKKMNYVKVERDVMTKLKHFNITRLLLTFQDPNNLYYVIELGPHGDLQVQLNKLYSIDLPIAKILLGQLLLAIAHIHQHRILHRDLKPENILLDEHNRVKVTDFGTAKIYGENEPFHSERSSFVGSADYVSPEILNETEVGPSSDLWSYGCIIYTLLVGYPPYHTQSNYATFGKIQSNSYELPDFLPEDAKDLIKKILVLDPEKRLGHNTFDSNYEPIRNHPFFSDIQNWSTLPKTQIEELRPYQPAVEYRDHLLASQPACLSFLEEDENVNLEASATFINSEGKSKEVNLIMTDKPRIVVFNMKKTKVKAEIPMIPEVQVEKVDPLKLKFSEPETSFFIVFKTEKEASFWFETVTLLIKNED
ncbi:3-phosphoinositide dependent protein kinase-1 [Tritrichomonas musculus]|uniref:non-specific serine/threonine protein kinase n=1 Tax=Tritrichomonas musculus TaxID=1915356 RepID=A0ABR2KRQ5_9EUKA